MSDFTIGRLRVSLRGGVDEFRRDMAATKQLADETFNYLVDSAEFAKRAMGEIGSGIGLAEIQQIRQEYQALSLQVGELQAVQQQYAQNVAAVNAQMIGSMANVAAASEAQAGDVSASLAAVAASADETSASLAQLTIGPAQLTISNDVVDSFKGKLAEIDVDSWQYKIAAGIGTGVGAGVEGARRALDAVEEYAKAKVAITATAIATGIAAATLSAVYAAYKATDFAVGLITGESYKRAEIDSLLAKVKEVRELRGELIISNQQAGLLLETFSALGVSQAAYTSVQASAASAIRSNTEALNELGLEYGNVDALIRSANNLLNEYNEGWDRNQMAAQIGIGSAQQVAEAARVTAVSMEEARQRLQDYNLGVGVESAAAAARYQDVMREFNHNSDLTAEGFKRAWADQIMPMLTDLADFFKTGWPYAVNAFRYSLATITSLVYGLKTALYAATESILGTISAIADGVGGVVSAMSNAVTGDWDAAQAALVRGWEAARGRLASIGDNIVEQARHNSAAMRQAWAFDDRTDLPGPDMGKKGYAEVAANKAALAAHKELIDSVTKGAEKYREQADRQVEANDAIGKTAQELAKLEAAELREQAVAASRLGLRALEKNSDMAAYEAYKAQATALNELAEAKERAPGLKAGYEAAQRAREQYDSLISSIKGKIDAQNLELASGEKLTEGQKMAGQAMVQLRDGTLQLSAAQTKVLTSQLELMLSNEKQIDGINREREATKAAIDARIKYMGAQDSELSKLRDQVEQQRAVNDSIGLGESAVAALAAAKLRAQAATLQNMAIRTLDKNLDEEQYQIYMNQAAALLELADLKESNPGLQAAFEAQKKAADEALRSAQSIGAELADSMMNGFSDFGSRLKKMFSQLVLQPMLAPIFSPIGAGLSSALYPGANPGAAGEPVSLLQGLSNAVSMFQRLPAGIENSVANGVQGAINWIRGSGGSISQGPIQISPVASYAGQTAAAISSIMGARTLGNAISGGYSIGGHGQAIVNIGSLFGPIGGVAAGLLNRAFGMGEKTATGATMTGQLGAGGLTGGQINTSWHQDGGWFRSDRNGVDVRALDQLQQQQIGDVYKGLRDATAEYARVLGLSADSIISRSREMNIVWTADASANEKALQEFFAGIGNSMATELLPSLNQFTKAGEAASATLQRLVDDYQAVDAVLLTIGKKDALGVGADSIAARERLVNGAGGADKLAQGTAYYAQNFLPLAKQIEPIAASLDKKMAELGYSSIKTVDQFAQLVQSLDLSAESGAAAYGVLIGLAPQFKQVADYAQAAADERKNALLTRADSEYAVLARAVDRQKAVVKAGLDAQVAILTAQKSSYQQQYEMSKMSAQASVQMAQTTQSRLSALAASLKSSLTGFSPATVNRADDRQAAAAQISAALALARKGRQFGDISESLKSVTQAKHDDYATYQDFAADYYRTAGEVAELADLTQSQLTQSEEQLTIAKEQLAALESQRAATIGYYDQQEKQARADYDAHIAEFEKTLQTAQEQLDVAKGTYVEIKNMGEALAGFRSAVAALSAPVPASRPSIGAPAAFVGPPAPTPTPVLPTVPRSFVGPPAPAPSDSGLRAEVALLRTDLTKALNTIAVNTRDSTDILDRVTGGGSAMMMEALP